jgi:uncharacterized protein YqhQ
MRTASLTAVSIRRTDGTIHSVRQELNVWRPRGRLTGLAVFVNSFRASLVGFRVAIREQTGNEPTMQQMLVSLVAGGVGITAVFIEAPGLLLRGKPGLTGAALEASVRIAMLFVYTALMRRSSYGRRLFSLHGAEHKVIAAHESLDRLPTLEEARRFSPIHARCGGTFLTLFALATAIGYAFIPTGSVLLGAVIRLALVPIIGALAMDLMRAAVNAQDTMWARLLLWPGRLLQRITTREPDDDELDVALAALETLLAP